MSPITRRRLGGLVSATAIVATLVVSAAAPTLAAKPTDFDNQTGKVTKTMDEAGFNENGYNYQANIFSGRADGSDGKVDGTVWGDPTYANDKLVMKWSQAWDDAKYHGAEWTTEAWSSNEWNGMGPDGTGEVWHFKMQWIGPNGVVAEGAYRIWNDFQVVMDHGTSASDDLPGRVHEWLTHAAPSGYGS